MASINPSLNLVCGEPQGEQAATFSRFVFPFVYQLEAAKQDALPKEDDLHYEAGQEEAEYLQDRRDYFTFETAEALFDRAQWLRMNKEAWKKSKWGQPLSLSCRGEAIQVQMQPPRLVLFEWQPRTADHGRPESLLQTGFLLVDLFFPKPDARDQSGSKQPDLTDLLEINEIFRCHRRPYEAHWGKFKTLLHAVPVTQNGEPTTIGSYPDNEYQAAYCSLWLELLSYPLADPEESGRFFRLAGPTKEQTQKQREKFLPYADHRAYVWTCAILQQGGKSLGRAFHTSTWHAHAYGHWIKLLNVDSPAAEFAPERTHYGVMEFERKWAHDRTYHRWEEWGTWYGFSYHSGAMLGPEQESSVPLCRHFRHMYFDIALLLLYIRVTLFRFSRELSASTHEHNPDKRGRLYTQLRDTFILFTIRYQFPLLSNQQQAIEMYNLAREHFDIEKLYDEVRQEIETAHEFVSMRQAEQQAKAANDLTRKGIPLAMAAVVAGIFGMLADDYNFAEWVTTLFVDRDGSMQEYSTIIDRLRSFFVLIMITFLAWSFTWRHLNKKDPAENEKKDD